MSNQRRGPVEVLFPICVPNSMDVSDRHFRQVGRRRIFVQTDDGGVLDVEVDRADNASKVKKAVQAALHLPTDGYDLVMGGLVLEDLSKVRNDAPVMLQRGFPRTTSSPCLSPNANTSLEKGKDKCLELVGSSGSSAILKRIMKEASKALSAGIQPVSATGGLGGAYYFKNRIGENIAIVKPTDEEPFAPNNPNGYVGRALGQPGMKRSIRVGEAAVREVAAFLLDHGGFANVPHTALVKVKNSKLNVNEMRSKGKEGPIVATKIASFQKFVKHDFDASDCGTSKFPVRAVHRIGILDIRIFNLDRHSGNILIRKTLDDEPVGWGRSSDRVEDAVELNPIDHGFSLPESLESPYFEWQHWPQASLPFTEDELEYISHLDPFAEVEMLRRELPMLREASLRILVLSTTLLKRGAMAGLTLSEIAGMMCSELRGMEEEPSELERLCLAAKVQLGSHVAASYSNKSSVSSGSSIRGHLYGEFEEGLEQFELELDIDQEELLCGRELSFGRGLDCVVDRSSEQSSDEEESSESSHDSPSMASFSGFRSGLSPLMASLTIGSPAMDGMNFMARSVHMGCVQSTPSKAKPIPQKTMIPTVRQEGFKVCSTWGDDQCDPPAEKDPLTPITVKGFTGSVQAEACLPFDLKLTTPDDEIQKAFPKEGELLLGELSEVTWRLFLTFFEDNLRDVLMVKMQQSNAAMKRFGTSCKF